MGKTYAFLEIENPREIICAFTVSNASIFTNHLPNARRKRIGKDVPQQKRDMIYPAVLIGRPGVNSKFLRQHIGTELRISAHASDVFRSDADCRRARIRAIALPIVA